jgi:hypothetical protein
MSYAIPVRADFTSKDELADLLSNLKTDPSVSIEAAENSGLAMDPATVALVFGTINVVVPALITALATVWVEHIKNKKADKPKEKPDTSQPIIIVETDIENIRVVLDVSDVRASVTKARLPVTIEEITRIRLEM